MRMSLRPSWSHVLSRFNETIGWVGGGLAKRRRLPFARRTGLFQRPAVPLQTCRGSPPFLLLLTPAQYTGSYAPQIGGHIQNSVTSEPMQNLAEILPQSVGFPPIKPFGRKDHGGRQSLLANWLLLWWVLPGAPRAAVRCVRVRRPCPDDDSSGAAQSRATASAAPAAQRRPGTTD